MINEFKDKVKDLINNNKIEITSKTNINTSGIYMIYIDDFSNDKIIPFYVGQTHNFQQRHKQHFREILNLNRLDYQTYKSMFFFKENGRGSFYDGSFKSCKIFKYMIEHKLTLSQWHMIVLDECDKTILDEREQYYFDYLKPAFFGFNQLNTHIELLKASYENELSSDKIKLLLSYINKDIVDIEKFYNYGFTKFNYLYSFTKGGVNFDSDNEDIINKMSNINNAIKELNKTLGYTGEYTTERYENLRTEHLSLSQEKEQIIENVKANVKEFLKKNKIEASNMQTWIEDIVIYKSEKSKLLLDKYMRKRLYKDKVYLFISDMNAYYYTILNKHESQFELYWKEKLEILKRRKEDKDEVLNLIFPNCSFNSFALNSSYNFKLTRIENIDNYCILNFVLSNNGKNKIPDLIKVDYLIENENLIESYNYIDCETNRFIKSNKFTYQEKDFIYRNMYKEPFNVIPIYSKSQKQADYQISVLSEYKNGLNDINIQSQKLTSIDKVFEDIYKYTNENTRYQINVSEFNSILEWSLSRLNTKHFDDDFIQKLLKKKLFGLYDVKKIKQIKEKNKSNLKKSNPKPTINKTELWNNKILVKSENKISVIDYINAKLPLTAKCNVCNNIWKIRCDHLLDRTYCPKCKKT